MKNYKQDNVENQRVKGNKKGATKRQPLEVFSVEHYLIITTRLVTMTSLLRAVTMYTP
jgi:hypothetical protein